MQDENDDDDSYYMRCPQCDGVGTFIYPQRASSSSFAAGREGPDSSVEAISATYVMERGSYKTSIEGEILQSDSTCLQMNENIEILHI